MKLPLRSTSVVPSSRRMISRGTCPSDPGKFRPLLPEKTVVTDGTPAVDEAGGGGPPASLRIWLSKVISV